MLIVFDTDSGKQVTQLESIPAIDGLWYDATRKRIYVTGDGFIAVYQQKSADEYMPMVKVATEADTQPSIWVPQFNRCTFPFRRVEAMRRKYSFTSHRVESKP